MLTPCFSRPHLLASLLLLTLLPQVAKPEEDVVYHGPRDRFWRHHVVEESLIVDGAEHYGNLTHCLNETLTERDWQAMKTDKPEREIARLVRQERDEFVILVHISNAMAPIHVRAVQTLAACVRRHIPQFHESRAYFVEQGFDEDPGGLGGNNPTHLAPLVGMFLPEVVRGMQDTLELAYLTAGWNEKPKSDPTRRRTIDDEDSPEEAEEDEPTEPLPHPSEIGFRACEHLTYNDFKEGLSHHTDGPETVYTLNYAFSGPQDYSGGEFYVDFDKVSEDDEEELLDENGEPEQTRVHLMPQKFDALVLLGGEIVHGVEEIVSGTREMFSSELWRYPDMPVGGTLWSGVEWKMQKYLHLCNEEESETGHTGPCTVDLSDLEEDEVFFNEVVFDDDDDEGDDEEYEGEEDEEANEFDDYGEGEEGDEDFAEEYYDEEFEEDGYGDDEGYKDFLTEEEEEDDEEEEDEIDYGDEEIVFDYEEDEEEDDEEDEEEDWDWEEEEMDEL